MTGQPLTLDGDSMPSDPPTRIYCPACDKLVRVTRIGTVPRHRDYVGERCRASGLRPEHFTAHHRHTHQP